MLQYNNTMRQPMSLDEKRSRIDNLDIDAVYRWCYVPYCVAEGVWDYADSIIDVAIQMQKTETKVLSRSIRELRRQYEKKRQSLDMAGGSCHIEMMNFYDVEEVSKNLLGFLISAITKSAKKQYPEASNDDIVMYTAIYSCHYLLKALYKYTEEQTKRICNLCGFDSIGNILPDELKELDKVVLAFARGKEVKVNGAGLFVHNMVRKLNSTVFINKRIEE